eukprot:gene9104-10749_t
MTAQSTQPEPVALSMRQPSIPSIPSIPVTEEVVYLPPAHEFLKPVRNSAIIATPVEIPGESVAQSAVAAPVIPTGKPKWVPGKAGAFVSVDNTATAEKSPEKPAADISPVSMENLSRKEQKQLRREKMIQDKQLGDYIPGGAAGGNLNKKQMKALLQKKKQQQNNEVSGSGVTASTSATSTGTSISSVTTINSPAKAQPVLASKTKASALVAAKENAIPSTYVNEAIAKAMSKYHAQNEGEHSNSTLFIPSYSSAAAANQKLPDMSMQKGPWEKDNLKLHFCNSQFEAYSASYLTTKQHMLAVASESFNLSWVNCEMASFIHMKASAKFYNNPKEEGVIIQSLDVLDFSVIHLSAYERSSHKHRDKLWKNRKDMIREWHNIDPVINAGKRLAYLNDPLVRNRSITYLPEAQRTVVVMPFLGGAMGAGHSKLNNRYEYLKTCFWSLYEYFPHIVAGVTRQEDVDWCMKESGLPFFETILMPALPKSAGLPVGLTQQTKKRLQDGRWDFDYVFFTESDQILISRELPMMYAHLKTYPGHMLIPHRLMPYSNRVMAEAHNRDLSTAIDGAWAQQSCCMPRQNCQERKSWLPVGDTKVPFINYYGLYVPLGNVNFLAESYRYCSLTQYVGEQAFCP